MSYFFYILSYFMFFRILGYGYYTRMSYFFYILPYFIYFRMLGGMVTICPTSLDMRTRILDAASTNSTMCSGQKKFSHGFWSFFLWSIMATKRSWLYKFSKISPKGSALHTSTNNTSYSCLKALSIMLIKLNRSFYETNFILHTRII